jgi:hypothetical protein
MIKSCVCSSVGLELSTFNGEVVGSNPSRRTKNKYSDLYQWLDKSPHKGMVAGSSPAVGTKT